MVGEVDRNQHSVYRLSYHLVLVIKYRRNVINQDIFDRLIDIFENIGEKYSIECSQSNWESDHIHIFI